MLERLRADKDGVVSFEYVIVAACIVAAVAAAFGTARLLVNRGGAGDRDHRYRDRSRYRRAAA